MQMSLPIFSNYNARSPLSLLFLVLSGAIPLLGTAAADDPSALGKPALQVSFGSDAPGQLPSSGIISGDGSGNTIAVAGADTPQRNPFSGIAQSLFLYQQDQDNSPRVIFPLDGPVARGRWTVQFWPESSPTHASRIFLSLREKLQPGLTLQSHGTRLFFTDQEGRSQLFDQSVALHAENKVVIDFDFERGVFSGTLNDESLTSQGYQEFPVTGSVAAIDDTVIWLRAAAHGVFLGSIDIRGKKSPSDSESIAEGSVHPELHIHVLVEDQNSNLPTGDQRPARMALDFNALAQQSGLPGSVDLGSLRIYQLDANGAPVPAAKFAYATDSRLPLRWDDSAIPEDFPGSERAVDPRTGRIEMETMKNEGLFFNVTGTTKKGHLVWPHTRIGSEPGRYLVKVALIPLDQDPSDPPRGWIGDGVARFTTEPTTTTGSGHTRIDITDWNENGKLDIIYGEHSGRLMVLLNQGTNEAPEFDRAQFITDTRGIPLDAGQTSAPFVVDWDGDGKKDLLVGTHWNRILFYKNMGGEPGQQRFEYRGPVLLSGRPLELPIDPVVGRPAGAFERDYYPRLAMMDWTGNGRPDLLVGGYLTGRIYVFENTGRRGDGTPNLRDRGPIEADGEILNVGDWSAAPTVADFNGDGLPDIVSGNLPMSRESVQAATPLRYYENIGSPGAPKFTEKPIPITGRLPRGNLYAPRAADMNGNGLMDLVIGAGTDIFWLRNIGTADDPVFEFAEKFLPTWGNTPLVGTQFIDWNGNGLLDAVANYTVRYNLGTGDPFLFGPPERILPPGQHIAHPSGIGDDWFHPRFYDFNGNGELDILFGDWHGQVWLHRNLGGGQYDLEGELLHLTSGDPIKVGPTDLDPEDNFIALQGARTVLTAHDFTGNGNTDLVLGDTNGIVTLFENVGSNDQPIFEKSQIMGDLGIRLSVDMIDWNNDGHMDVVAGAANGRVAVFLNRPNQSPDRRFAAGIDPELPPIPQPRVITVDLNHDGDVDFLVPSTQGSVWLERSFIDHGYATGVVQGVQIKSGLTAPDR